MYAPSDCMDSEDIDNGTFRTGLSSSNSNMLPLQCSANSGNIPTNAKQVRREFINYFNTDGQVPWHRSESQTSCSTKELVRIHHLYQSVEILQFFSFLF